MFASRPAATAPKVRVPLKNVALPNEHGVWGFWLEPSLLGLLLAPSLAGLALSLAALAAVLAQHPLSLTLADRRRGKRYPRTVLAERFALGYGFCAALLFALALLNAASLHFLLPLLVALPFALTQLIYDRLNRSREALPEVVGALALTAVAPAVLLVGGGLWPLALLAWAVLALRNLGSVVYVRERVKVARKQEPQARFVLALNVAVTLVVLSFAALDLWSWGLLLPFGLLLGRALLGMSRWHLPLKAKHVGMLELLWGFLVVASAGLLL